METEAAAVEEEDAHIQLGTWVHFARLQQLVPAGIQMPILPFIKDQDYNWKTMIAEKIGNGSILIWMDEALGGRQKGVGYLSLEWPVSGDWRNGSMKLSRMV